MKVLRKCGRCKAEIIEESKGKIKINIEIGAMLCDECVKLIEKYGGGAQD